MNFKKFSKEIWTSFAIVYGLKLLNDLFLFFDYPVFDYPENIANQIGIFIGMSIVIWWLVFWAFGALSEDFDFDPEEIKQSSDAFKKKVSKDLEERLKKKERKKERERKRETYRDI